MTICIATDSYYPQVGGIATFNKHLVALLLSAGHKVILLSFDHDSDAGDMITTEGELIRVQLKKTYIDIYKKWAPYFRPGGFDAPNWIAAGMAMRKWLLENCKKYQVDIIEASDYGGYGIFFNDSDLPPVVLTGHGSLLQYSRYNFTRKDDSYEVVRKLEELSFINAEAVISHSPLNSADLKKLFKRDISFATIPWTNPPVTKNDALAEVNTEPLVVAGLQPIKGIYDMMDAMELLRTTDPGIKIVWIGGDTFLAPRQQKMSTYLAAKYPGTWLQTLSWKNELPYSLAQEYIRSASLIVIPAFFETFNYIALEAAANHTPIIITEGTGASFIFTHSVDAWIIPANDPAALATALRYLLANPGISHKLGDNAYKIFEKTFKAEKIVSERIVIYTSTINNRKNTRPGLHPALSFLDAYRVPRRKFYYRLRAIIKKMIGRK